MLQIENQRLRLKLLKLRYHETKALQGPASFVMSKDEVRHCFAPGVGLISLKEGITIFGFEFGVTLFACGDGRMTSWDLTPLPDDGFIPMVEVWVRRTPDLGPNGLQGKVTLSGETWSFGISKFEEEGPLTEPTWASCGVYDFGSVKSSSLLEMDTTIVISISKVVLQDGTVPLPCNGSPKHVGPMGSWRFSEPEPELTPSRSVEERLSLLERENQRLCLKMCFLETEDMRAPAVFTFSKAQVRTRFTPGASLDSGEDGIPVLGFEVGVSLYPFGTGDKTYADGRPLPEDGFVPVVYVWVKQNPNLGPDVPRCINLVGEVTFNGKKAPIGDKYFEDVLRPDLLKATSWALCQRVCFPSVKSSSLLDVDSNITISISSLGLQDGTVLSSEVVGIQPVS